MIVELVVQASYQKKPQHGSRAGVWPCSDSLSGCTGVVISSSRQVDVKSVLKKLVEEATLRRKLAHCAR